MNLYNKLFHVCVSDFNFKVIFVGELYTIEIKYNVHPKQDHAAKTAMLHQRTLLFELVTLVLDII